MDLTDNMGLVKLPARLEIILYLIKAELKNRKFTRCLEDIGFDSTFCTLDFSSLILRLSGIDLRSDETFEHYNNLVEKYIEDFQLKECEEVLTELALRFYSEIEKLKPGSHPA